MYGNILMPVLMNIGNLLYVIVALAGGLLLALGIGDVSLSGLPLTIAVLVPFLHMTKQFCGQIGQISMQINAVVMGLAGAGRIFGLLDEEPEADEGYVTLVNTKYDESGHLVECAERTTDWAWKHPHHDGTVTYTPLAGDVRMEHVDFGYTDDHQVLYDVSVYAKPGQKVAFVGATGAGKTTITNLINRFYDIADGKIRYDGINVNKICKGDLRRSLGVVLQDVNLFTGTVMDNIRYGKLDATDEECMAAARLAGADDFICRLPDGYQTMLTGNGSQLSQGQRQLISIARAAVADPPAMILDEATSSIDTRTEAIVQRGMDALMTGRTTFVIAHRLSTVRNSDVIICLDHGHVIERGNHDELIAKKGYYYQLYTGAFELRRGRRRPQARGLRSPRYRGFGTRFSPKRGAEPQIAGYGTHLLPYPVFCGGLAALGEKRLPQRVICGRRARGRLTAWHCVRSVTLYYAKAKWANRSAARMAPCRKPSARNPKACSERGEATCPSLSA